MNGGLALVVAISLSVLAVNRLFPTRRLAPVEDAEIQMEATQSERNPLTKSFQAVVDRETQQASGEPPPPAMIETSNVATVPTAVSTEEDAGQLLDNCKYIEMTDFIKKQSCLQKILETRGLVGDQKVQFLLNEIESSDCSKADSRSACRSYMLNCLTLSIGFKITASELERSLVTISRQDKDPEAELARLQLQYQKYLRH